MRLAFTFTSLAPNIRYKLVMQCDAQNAEHTVQTMAF